MNHSRQRVACLLACRCARRWLLVGLVVPSILAQDRPLERRFAAGDSASYRIKLSVRSEVTGQQTEAIGAKIYVRPFSRAAEGSLSWTSTRRVVAVGADGSADVEETLDSFESGTEVSWGDEQAAKLAGALHDALAGWATARTLRYREARSGHLLDLKPDGVPILGEAPPALLTLWLLRALRPSVALPGASLRFGEAWQEARTAQLPNWTAVSGSEKGEWLEARGAAEPAARLHLVQQLSGEVAAGPEKPPEGTAQGRFYGESLNTVSPGDGRLLSATRSATREVAWMLARVEGLPERPQFIGRLTVQIEIEGCNENPCLPAEPAAGRNRK